MITFIPKRPELLTSSMAAPGDMQLLAFEKAYKEYIQSFNYSFISRKNEYWDAQQYAMKDALIALSVFLSFACEGILYE